MTLNVNSEQKLVSGPLYANNGAHLYPESTTMITEIEATGVQLKPETFIEWSMALRLTS